MTDTDRNFLASICAEPDSDLPRLVYADWLDEHGDPRGEFIRLQCRLALGCTVCDGTGRNVMSPCPCSLLRSRERELLDGPCHNCAWHDPLPHGGTRWEYVRGFVSRLTISWQDWAGGLCPNGGSDAHYHNAHGCIICKGTGRIKSHADALLAACPIRRIDRAPRRECPACNDLAFKTWQRYCPNCHGTGTLPVVPDWRGDGLVRITGDFPAIPEMTFWPPFLEPGTNHRMGIPMSDATDGHETFSIVHPEGTVLWPDVRFELPAQPSLHLTLPDESHEDAMRRVTTADTPLLDSSSPAPSQR